MGMTARGLCNSNIVQRKMMQAKHMVWGLVSAAVIGIVGCGGGSGNPEDPLQQKTMATINSETKAQIAESLKKVNIQSDDSFLKKAMTEFEEILKRKSIDKILDRELSITMENTSMNCRNGGKIILNVSPDYTGSADFKECKGDTIVFNGKIEVLQNDGNTSEVKLGSFSAKLDQNQNKLDLSDFYMLVNFDKNVVIKLGESSVLLDGEKIDFKVENISIDINETKENEKEISIDTYSLANLFFRNTALDSWIKINTVKDFKLKHEYEFDIDTGKSLDRDSITEGKLEISGSDESKVTFEIKDENKLKYTGVDNETRNYDINLSNLDDLLDQLKN